MKLFDDWSDVKGCHECEHYYTNACDGFSEQQEGVCNAFKLIRGIDMPRQIKRLEAASRLQSVALILCGIALVAVGVTMMIWGWTP